MSTLQINRYKELNKLASSNGIVILGGSGDIEIPAGELRQAFAIEEKIYNRSLDGLSIRDAASFYDECASSLSPDTVLIHLGADDLEFFCRSSAEFDECFRSLISRIRKDNKKCCITIISLRDYNSDAVVAKLNTHLSYIAQSEQCEYADISQRRPWNPQSTMKAASFVYSTGFVRPLQGKRPIHDLVKILFCSMQDVQQR